MVIPVELKLADISVLDAQVMQRYISSKSPIWKTLNLLMCGEISNDAKINKYIYMNICNILCITCYVSHAMCHASCAMCHLSPVTCDLSPDQHSLQLQLLRMLADTAGVCLVIDRVKKWFFFVVVAKKHFVAPVLILGILVRTFSTRSLHSSTSSSYGGWTDIPPCHRHCNLYTELLRGNTALLHHPTTHIRPNIEVEKSGSFLLCCLKMKI